MKPILQRLRELFRSWWPFGPHLCPACGDVLLKYPALPWTYYCANAKCVTRQRIAAWHDLREWAMWTPDEGFGMGECALVSPEQFTAIENHHSHE